MDRKLAEHLVDQQILSRQEMQRCILKASMEKSSVIGHIAQMPQVDEANLARQVAAFFGYDYLDETSIRAQPYALKLISAEMAEAHGVLPLHIDAETDAVSLAVSDPYAAKDVIASIKASTGKTPLVAVVGFLRLEREIYRHYRPNNDDATPSAGALKKSLNTASTPLPAGVGAKDRSLTREVEVDDDDDFTASAPSRTNGAADDFDLDDFDLGLSAPSPSGFGEPVDFGFGAKPFAPASAQVLSPGAAKPRSLTDSGAALKPPAPKPPAPKPPAPKPPSPTRSSSWAGESKDSAPVKPQGTNDRSRGGDARDVAGALDQFDAFLDEKNAESSGMGLSNWGRPSGRPGFASPPGFSIEDSDSAGLSQRPSSPEEGFDLFDEPQESRPREVELTLQELVEQNQRTILRLEREVEHQRNVLQTLSDLLVEARVLSRRQLKERLLALRKK